MNEVLDLAEKLPKFESVRFVRGNNGMLLKEEEVDEGIERLKGYVCDIHELSKGVVKSYIEIGKILREIEADRLYNYVHIKAQSYVDVFDFAYKIFGFSKTTTYGLLNVVKRFAPHGGITKEYQKYSYSKLVELLPIEEERLERMSPEMTVQEIRELRKIWDKYGYSETGTWKEELQRGRERAAQESAQAKQQEKKTGLLELLAGEPSNPVPAVPAVQQPIVRKSRLSRAIESLLGESDEEGSAESEIQSEKEPRGGRLLLKNKAAREGWLKAYEAWGVWLEVPELALKCYRYEFVNGTALTVTVGHEYWDAWSTHKGAHEKIVYTIQDEEHETFSLAGSSFTAVIEWLTNHAKEI